MNIFNMLSVFWQNKLTNIILNCHQMITLTRAMVGVQLIDKTGQIQLTVKLIDTFYNLLYYY